MSDSETDPDEFTIYDIVHPGAELSRLVGAFFINFTRCEFLIGMLLNLLTKPRDIASFELLIRGMDARVKCERLRRAMTLYKVTSPNFTKKMAFFEDKVIRLRNELAHTPLVASNNSNMQKFFMGYAEGRPKRKLDTEWVHATTFWMSRWYMDIALALHLRYKDDPEKFDTSGRHPPPQRGANSGPRRLDPDAIPPKPPQKP